MLVIIIVFMCSLMPWWIVLLLFGVAFIYNFFLCDDSIFKIQPFKPMKNKKRVKKKIEQQKKTKNQKKTNKPVRKQDGRNLTGKAKTKKSSVVSDTATVLAGAALAHQLRKHHKHDDISDIEDSYYDYERAAYEEEQAAYDDFIASNDMDND